MDKQLYYENVRNLKGIGDKKTERLSSCGINTIGDLLEHYPYKYRDRRSVVPSSSVIVDKDCLVAGTLLRISSRPVSGRKSLIECFFRDDFGRFTAVFFNRTYLRRSLNIGEKYSIYGHARIRNGMLSWVNPEIAEFDSSTDKRGIVPVYRCTQGITNNDYIKWISQALDELEDSDWLDEDILNNRKICSQYYAYKNIHFPESELHYKTARFRLIYEELLIYQLAIRLNRMSIDTEQVSAHIEDIDIQPFIDSLPFTLTEGQVDCIRQIEKDLIDAKPMNRMVQGDVGCGKTVVAEAAIFKCVKAGMQAAMMAPTELLARQHYSRLVDDFAKHNIKCCLLVSGLRVNERREILNKIASGEVDVIIGTHAVIQKDVEFANLGIAITDEQHRFGVNQRKALVKMGRAVNVCVMSATPIPRTLAATVFGDMDFSVIRHKPRNRMEIITRSVTEAGRERAYAAVLNELKKGHQAYVVAPSIDNDDDLASVEQLYDELNRKFRGYQVALLHGKLDKDEKSAVMNDFASGKIDILVATVVIEVGIDVSNATIIVLENCDRYGLAQMHQLRGRVGRSEFQSYCYLVNYSKSDTAVARIEAMKKYSDGFMISEEDYRLRGPGDIMGTMQSGNYNNRVIALCGYTEILNIAIDDANTIISEQRGHIIEHVKNRMNMIDDNSNIL